MRSLRGQLVLTTTLAAGIIFLLAALILYDILSSYLNNEFDKDILSSANALAGFVEDDGKKVIWLADETYLPQETAVEHSEYLEVWDGSRVVHRSSSLALNHLAPGPRTVSGHSFQEVQLPDNAPGRQVTLAFTPLPIERPPPDDTAADDLPEGRPTRRPPPPGRPHTVYLALARDSTGLNQTLSRLRTILFTVGLGSAVISGFSLILLIRRAVKPVSQLAATLSAMPPTELARRIEVPHAPAELQPVVASLNGLLLKLDQTLQRERAFSSEVAHELRTPLAGIRATIEVATLRSRTPEEYTRALADCLAISSQMERLVENLLSLARLDARQVRQVVEPIPLDAFLPQCFAPFAPRAAERNLNISWQIHEGFLLTTDRELLRLALANLFDNAVSYTNPAGHITIEAAPQNNAVQIRITNTGCTLTPQQAQLAAERFWRGDSARSHTGLHCGLGLALVKQVAHTLGGNLAIEAPGNDTFIASLHLSSTAST